MTMSTNPPERTESELGAGGSPLALALPRMQNAAAVRHEMYHRSLHIQRYDRARARRRPRVCRCRSGLLRNSERATTARCFRQNWLVGTVLVSCRQALVGA
jgi:hypothetical protein